MLKVSRNLENFKRNLGFFKLFSSPGEILNTITKEACEIFKGEAEAKPDFKATHSSLKFVSN